MKNLKKLSAAFMLAALFSFSLTSCIDNNVDPVVEAIYANQADLIAAQAGVQNAQANLLAAQAAAATSAADNLAAITAANVASTNATTDAFISSSAQLLIAQVAATELAVENARIAMLLAQAQFDQDVAQILAAIRAASNIEAGIHAADYTAAMGQLANLKSQKLTLLASIAKNELYMKSIVSGSEMTWATYLANLQSNVTAKEASVIANAAYIVRANEYKNSTLPGLQAAYDTAKAAETAKQAEIQVLIDEDTQINADILAGTGNFDTYQSNYVAMLALLQGNGTTSPLSASGLEGNLAYWEGIVTTLTTNISNYATTIANYAGTTSTLTTDVTNATTALGTAQGSVNVAAAALGTVTTAPSAGDPAISPSTSLYDDLYNAQLEKANATAALSTLQGIIAGLEASLNAAAVDLAAKQTTYDAGIGAATTLVTNTGIAVTNAQNAIDTALITYTTWKDRFEGTVGVDNTANGGFFWEDTLPTPSLVLGDNVLGIHANAGGVASTTYVQVLTWTWADLGLPSTVLSPDAADSYTPLTLGTVQKTALTGTDVAILGNGNILNPAYQLSSNILLAGVKYWVEVGMDDQVTSNLTAFQAATTALGNSNIFDTAPTLGATLLVGTDTYTAKWNAMVANLNAIDVLAHFGDIRDAAQVVYDDLKAVYENELTLLNAAQALEATKITAVGTTTTGALGAVTAAAAALGTVTTAPSAGAAAIAPSTSLFDDLYNAQLVLADANAALTTHTGTTVAAYTALKIADEASLVTANNWVSEINILIVRKTADIVALTAEYNALVATPLYAAQQVRLLEIADEKAVLVAQKLVLTNEAAALTYAIMFEGVNTGSVMTPSLTALDNAIAAAQSIIDGAPAYLANKAAAIALGEVTLANLVAEVEKLTADVADLDAEIAAKAAEAAGYLALLQAALGN